MCSTSGRVSQEYKKLSLWDGHDSVCDGLQYQPTGRYVYELNQYDTYHLYRCCATLNSSEVDHSVPHQDVFVTLFADGGSARNSDREYSTGGTLQWEKTT